MKLSELAASAYSKILIYGPSSTGKTCLAASFPGPIKYFDFDNKISSAASFYKNDMPRLEQIEALQYAQMDPKLRMQHFLKELNMIQQLQYAGKELPFKTIVLDSLTTFTHYLLEDYIHVSQKGLKRPLPDINCMQDYQLLKKHLQQIITGLLSLNCNVIFIAHSELSKDETSGAITNQVLMPGKLAAELPIYFEEVYYAKVAADGKFLLQTQSDSKTTCRTQRRLAKEIPASYASIQGLI